MRRAGRVVVAILVVLALAGVCLVLGDPLGRPEPAAAVPAVQVTAARTAAGTDAARLSTQRHGIAWRSAGRAKGVWVQTTFARRTVVNASTIIGAGPTLRVIEGRLQFSDGSVVAVHTNAGGSRHVVFAPRSVRWVRFIVTRVAADQRAVGLKRWTLRSGSRTPGIRPRGDAALAAAIRTSSGIPTGTRWTAAKAGRGQWLQLRWTRPVELSAVQLRGRSEGGVRAGELQFSDGSSVGVGTLEPLGGSATTIAFTPRSVTSVRFLVSSVDAEATASVQRFSAYAVGSRAPMTKSSTQTFHATATTAAACHGVRASGPTSALRLLCPSNGSHVSSTARLVLSGPARATLTVRAFVPEGRDGAVQVIASGRFDVRGTAQIALSTRRLVHGPSAIRITADGTKVPLYVQIVNGSGVRQAVPASTAARGMDLKYVEDFTSPLSVTRSGVSARYASGKPNGYGVDDFGDAIFAQPTGSNGNLATTDGYLRIRSHALAPGQKDPAGFGRKSVGGLVSSAHMGGSGFSAQYGYFEVRMLGPAGAGTWPAFWLLSTGSLYKPNTSTAEVDTVELYGEHPEGACQSTHNWVRGKNVNGRAFCGALRDGSDWALQWHTYGARISPTGTDFYIDGKHTDHTSAMVNNDQSFFFLVNLALGGGWPVDLSGTRSKVDLFVDSVRVWV